MYAITGITGQVGGEAARALLAAGLPVRAIVRDPRKAQSWAEKGCEIAVSDILDPASLTTALQGAEAVFILVPPVFDPAPDFAEARATAASLRAALTAAQPKRVVYLSTIGAQAAEQNLLSQHTLIEQELRQLPIPIAFLRPAWFMENYSWDIASARDRHMLFSFLQPLDKPVPMVATADIGRLVAELLQQTFTAHQTVELEGPARITPNEAAATFSALLNHPITIEDVPRNSWRSLFESQGMKNPLPRIRMLDGFNEGWIKFENPPSQIRKGAVDLKTVLQSLLARSV